MVGFVGVDGNVDPMKLSQYRIQSPAPVQPRPRCVWLMAWLVVWLMGLVYSGAAFAAVPASPADIADAGVHQFKSPLSPLVAMSQQPLLAQRAANKNQGTFLLISSSAVGAQVFINGVYVGEVNRRIRVMPGIRRLEVMHKDYVSRSIEVRILRGKTQQIRMDLELKASVAAGSAVRAGEATPGYGQQPGYSQAQVNVQDHSAPQQNLNQDRQGPSQMRQKPMAKRKKMRRSKRRRGPPAMAPYKAPPPPPRSTGSYMLSLLPLGLPQIVQKKPGLGLLFFLTQAGGLGAFGYYKFYMVPAFDKVSKQNIQNTESAIQKATGTERKRLIDDNEQYKLDSNQWKRQQNMFAYLGLGGFGLAYLAGVVEAMVMGPAQPKSPLENLLSENSFDCGSCVMAPAQPTATGWMQLVVGSELHVDLLRPHPVSQAPSLALNWTYSL